MFGGGGKDHTILRLLGRAIILYLHLARVETFESFFYFVFFFRPFDLNEDFRFSVLMTPDTDYFKVLH